MQLPKPLFRMVGPVADAKGYFLEDDVWQSADKNKMQSLKYVHIIFIEMKLCINFLHLRDYAVTMTTHGVEVVNKLIPLLQLVCAKEEKMISMPTSDVWESEFSMEMVYNQPTLESSTPTPVPKNKSIQDLLKGIITFIF